MITTVTTTTTTTTVVAAHFATIAGVVAVVALIIFLVMKELLSSTEADGVVSTENSGLAGKARLLADRANIAIFSLLFVFVAIVLTKVLEILG